MARLDTFTFRVTEDERKMIAELSERLQRSQSDSVRLVVRTAFETLFNDERQQAFENGRDVERRIAKDRERAAGYGELEY